MHLFLRRFPALGGLQLFALLCAMMAGTQSLHAGTIIVTTTADSGAGSLRAAIAAASDGDTIQFDRRAQRAEHHAHQRRACDR